VQQYTTHKLHHHLVKQCFYIYYIKFLHDSTIYSGDLHGVFVYLLYKIPTRFDYILWPSSRSVHIFITQNSYTIRPYTLAIFTECSYIYYKNSYTFRPYTQAIFTECSYIYYTKFRHGSTIYSGDLHGVFVYLLYKIPTRFDHILWRSSRSVRIFIV